MTLQMTGRHPTRRLEQEITLNNIIDEWMTSLRERGKL